MSSLIPANKEVENLVFEKYSHFDKITTKSDWRLFSGILPLRATIFEKKNDKELLKS